GSAGLVHVWDQVVRMRGDEFLNPAPMAGQVGAISFLALCVQGLFFAGSPYAGEGWTAQRYMAARNELHAVMGQVLNGILALVVRLIPFILVGLAAAAMDSRSSVTAPAAL